MSQLTHKRLDPMVGIAVILGNALAWCDFALYALFSPVLAQIFFPFSNHAVSVIMYFVVFTVSFFFRPIGSAMAGSFADKHGRKNTLLATVIISSIVTTLLGCIPSYATIGVLSPLLLLILRILQTMAVSSEPTNSGALLTESATDKNRGFATSCVMIGVYLGFFLGTVLFILVSVFLTQHQIVAWGWRLAFISSIVIGPVVAIILLRAKESPVFLQKKKSGQVSTGSPLLQAFSKGRKPMLIAFGFSVMMAAGNYFILGYIPDILTHSLHFSLLKANSLIAISILVSLVFIPVFGYLSDRIGRKPIMYFSAVGYFFLSYPILMLIHCHYTALPIIGLVLYGFLLAPTSSILPVAIAEMFPFSMRCVGGAMGYNFALVLFGGTAPIISEGLANGTGHKLAPAFFLMLVALINFIFIMYSKETKDEDISA